MPERFARLASQLTYDKDWKPITATVIDSIYHYARLGDLSANEDQDNSFYQIHVYYDVNGERFYDDFEQFEPLDPGHTIELLHNPADPRQNSLSPLKSGISTKILGWVLGIVFAISLIWLWHHFDLPDDYNQP